MTMFSLCRMFGRILVTAPCAMLQIDTRMVLLTAATGRAQCVFRVN